MNEISNYFEVLSHPVRYSILKSLDFHMRNFGEILDDVSNFDVDIGSSKLNFHLKKLVDMGIITKTDKQYAISEFGLKFLSLIQNFENLDMQVGPNEAGNKDEYQVFSKPEIEIDYNSEVDLTRKLDLPIINRPKKLPLLFSVFEYYEGKNYEYMEEQYSLLLPDPISLDIKPTDWIKIFSNSIRSLTNDKKSKEWLIDRILKLGYGTRGLQDYGLMDASIAVPPLNSLLTTLKFLLNSRGKAGLYAKTGMGKSRIALYIASYWMREYKTPILYLQNPNYINEHDINKLQDVLSENLVTDRKSPKWLIIIEDAHLANKNQLELLQKIITSASNRTYSIFVSFTDIALLNESKAEIKFSLEVIESLKNELIPKEYSTQLDLNQHWNLLCPYFKEWLKFISADVIFDLLPEPNFKDNMTMFQSPWAFVVSLGFLKNSLIDLQNSSETNDLPIFLYYTLAQIYIMRNEQNLLLSHLLLLLKNFFNIEITELFSEEWKKNIMELLNSWTLPLNRLLPPFKYVQHDNSLLKEAIINFYHIQWANEVCLFLESSNNDIDSFSNLFTNIFPFIQSIWKELDKENNETFNQWLRKHVKFDMNEQGDVRLTSFQVEPNKIKKLSQFTIPDDQLKNLKQSQLLNWMFIKSIIYD